MKSSLRGALTLGLILACARVRAAEPEHDRVIEIVVDAADLPDTRGELPVVVEAELSRLLAELDPRPPGLVSSADRRLLIELRPSPIPGTDDVLIHVIVLLDGKPIGDSATETCMACSDAQVGEKALILLEPLLPKLPAPAPAEPPAPAREPAQAEPLELATSRAPADRRLLIPGAALLSAGVVGLGLGVGLIAADERVISPSGALELEVVKYREAGIASAAIGGAAAVAGAALLGLALHRRSGSPERAAVLLLPTPGGVALTGRF